MPSARSFTSQPGQTVVILAPSPSMHHDTLDNKTRRFLLAHNSYKTLQHHLTRSTHSCFLRQCPHTTKPLPPTPRPQTRHNTIFHLFCSRHYFNCHFFTKKVRVHHFFCYYFLLLLFLFYFFFCTIKFWQNHTTFLLFGRILLCNL